MSYTSEPVKTYTQMTHAELFEAAVAAGMTFKLHSYVMQLRSGPKPFDQLSIDSGLLGADRERTRRVGAINTEIRARWVEFAAYLKTRLKPVGPA